MTALTTAGTIAIDRARASSTGYHAEHVIRSGPLQQTVIALLEGTRLAEHEADVPASIYVLTGALRVTADDPFDLTSGDVHELPLRRRSVVALADTVLLLTAVTGVSGDDLDEHVHELPRA
ncbi:hypothetical protein BH708_00510 [Brachybacterium sp. P6-10-X1]|uniref:hypothetical protein n=1 Tax=Brachybacterium sp. P6-10-X1 TaxID=1903186 RepID=UPI0009718366|nr:hypothetical protein [Brachybacterium sp. P6-10-X1]APX34528.1 hypothetical protein BH708_00510 [Brachybacterium sp. P6-10-X1]